MKTIPNLEQELADLRDMYISHVAYLIARVRTLEAQCNMLQEAASLRDETELLTGTNG